MITQDLLNELFDYQNGQLFNKTTRSPNCQKGKRAGGVNTAGYMTVSINNKRHYAHRVIWLMHNEFVSKDSEVDHINGIKNDNRIENLRLVTHQENSFNRKVKGYSWHKKDKKFRAEISLNGKSKFLGNFDTEQEAHQAYLDAKYELHIIKERVA